MRSTLKNMLKRTEANGFTVVELIVVISIIAILAGITIVGYGAWRTNATKAAVTSDLNGVISAMNNYKNFNNGYPTSPTFSGAGALFDASDNVTITYGYGDSKGYCINAQSTTITSIAYFVYDTDDTPQAGSCPTAPPSNAIAQSTSTTALSMSWNAVAGASSYYWQRATTPTFTSYNSGSGAATSANMTGLSSGTTYYLRVRATTTAGNTGWSPVITVTMPTP